MKMIHRYQLFSYIGSNNGWYCHQGSSNTLYDLVVEADKLTASSPGEWWHIVDMTTGHVLVGPSTNFEPGLVMFYKDADDDNGTQVSINSNEILERDFYDTRNQDVVLDALEVLNAFRAATTPSGNVRASVTALLGCTLDELKEKLNKAKKLHKELIVSYNEDNTVTVEIPVEQVGDEQPPLIKEADPDLEALLTEMENEEAEEGDWKVTLVSIKLGKMINAIKSVRQMTTMGLKEAKDVVEGAPTVLATGLSYENAMTMALMMPEDVGYVTIDKEPT